MRLILYLILFYLLYSIVKKLFVFLFARQSEIKGKPHKRVRTFDPSEIEDVDYEEVKRKDE